MDQLFIQIVGGLIVAALAAWFGFGGTKRVIIHRAGPRRRTGKWIILISVPMIFGGLAWMGNSNPQGFDDWIKPPAVYGFTLAGYGVIFFVIGKIVAWFQRP
ncbi:MAG: hypothetical protein LiPW15_620 [Parcubacteria group bacterium LiPW_15]|nr:MAG: hypothetical protein LiPW15_620 [Parcubacteria group bacterium LiPW_15]